MRPVCRGASPQAVDFVPYTAARPYLISRIGRYCSYCERSLATGIAVEHIQPKGLPQYAGLEGRWSNFLLACVNCNSTKKDKDVVPGAYFLPDRDNTFAAFEYTPDGRVLPSGGLNPTREAMAAATLALVGLDKRISQATDENGKMVAIDRVSQRMEAWATALETRADVVQAGSVAVRNCAARTAKATGYFSIWMKVFDDDADMRIRLIHAFRGTAGTQCFDLATGACVSPGGNPDMLASGGKI